MQALRRTIFGLAGLTALLSACGPNSEVPLTAKREHLEAFAAMLVPADNPTTLEGVALGRDLFFDPLLSADSTISCGTCHRPELAFSDGLPLSRGIAGRLGRRNTPGLANVGYLHQHLFWDGRAVGLEAQALHPIAEANEMGGDWATVLEKLRRHPDYWLRFRAAFGLSAPEQLEASYVGKALAQFQRTLVSSDSKYDRVRRGEAVFSAEEALGEAIFFDFADDPEGPFAGLPTGECAHCHTPPHFTNQRFFNNGLDAAARLEDFRDPGRGGITGSAAELGLFRAPGLRNVALTAPYMHDGRMATLEEVVAHYNGGGEYAENKSANVFPLGLDSAQATALVAFLKTLTDSSFVNQSAMLLR